MLIFVESEDQGLENEAKVRNELCAGLLLQGGKSAAGCLLHPLVAVQDALQQLGHQGFEVGVGRLADHPVGVAAECPAGDGADQGLLVTKTLVITSLSLG